jgi:ABC-type branched-subunit amino acid transport system substrate-binding protein
MSSDTTESIGRGMAYYYGQIRKKEKKFYILCQDYSFGHGMADGFKKGLKEYYPGAQIVGEDYHKLFLTDFAPYLTKIRASGAEVVWTGDWLPDSGNLLKQARQMGIQSPSPISIWMNRICSTKLAWKEPKAWSISHTLTRRGPHSTLPA